MTVERQVLLRFGDAAREAGTSTNLSAVRSDGPVLWVAGDETATVERLVADDPQRPTAYAGQRSFALTDLVDLPGPDDEEADVEGLARDGDHLWAVGSHSLRRKRLKAKHEGAKALARLARVSGQDNRQLLARIPVMTDDDGLPSLVGDGACVFTGLRDLLADDPRLAPFLEIPGKDNGLDVEGIAVRGPRVLLGLRGPVLRGWALLLELRPEPDDDDPARLVLRPFQDGERYRTHLLDLDGLGVRDLAPDGDDLLVLAGPSMDLDGPVRVYRWHGGCTAEEAGVVRSPALTREVELSYGEGEDHAEGIGLLPEGRLLVVYDSPAPRRLQGEAVAADVVALPR